GAMGVIYWEPAWQSSPCRTPWGQGSHQEHATFFDFQNNLMADGGIRYYDYPYVLPATVSEPLPFRGFRVWPDSGRRVLTLQLEGFPDAASLQVKLLNSAGKLMAEQNLHVIANTALQVPIPEVPSGLYYIGLYDGTICLASRGIVLGL
ncbi:MAG: glycosyl hydrolase 53 family protein, partial [Saprospiraceae bacterium]|nr:glycosyl hydrolase 53 family protein [Saprospiraceae bacterium]